MEKLYERIGKKVNIKQLSEDICKTYELGKYKTHRIIPIGADDLSYYLYTEKGKYIVKNINCKKGLNDIGLWIKKNKTIEKNKIRAPKIIPNHGRNVFISELDGIYINSILMECIDGRDLWTLNEPITKQDIKKIVELAISFHKIEDKIEIEQYDEDCFVRLEEAYQKAKKNVSFGLKYDIRKYIKKMKRVDFNRLPKCFIHGDFISTNIMKDKKGEMWLIDFFESGRGIRILDIVKILNSVIFQYNYKEQADELETYFLQEYQKQMPLTSYELKVLGLLRKADAYTGIMLGTLDEKENNNEEVQYWLQNDSELVKRLKEV